MKDYFINMNQQTATRFWVNNPSCKEAELAIKSGALSCTTNPTYTSKMLEHKDESNEALSILKACINKTQNDSEVVGLMQQQLVKNLLAVFNDSFENNPMQAGFVSIQSNPHHEDDPQYILNEMYEYKKLGKNFISKIPVTKAGLQAIEEALKDGIPVVATEIMSLSQVKQVCEVENRVRAKMGKCPTLYITHITGIYNEYLRKSLEQQKIDIDVNSLALAGCAVLDKYPAILNKYKSQAIILGGGARKLDDFTNMVGKNMHVTINWSMAKELMQQDNDEKESAIEPIMLEKCAKLLYNQAPDFRKAFDEDGLSVEEFEEFGPVQYFRNMFIKGWDQAAAQVAKHRQETF